MHAGSWLVNGSPAQIWELLHEYPAPGLQHPAQLPQTSDHPLPEDLVPFPLLATLQVHDPSLSLPHQLSGQAPSGP